MPRSIRKFWEVSSNRGTVRMLVFADSIDEALRLAAQAGLDSDPLDCQIVDDPPGFVVMPQYRRYDVMITRGGASFPGPFRFSLLAHSAEEAKACAAKQFQLDHQGFTADHIKLENDDGVPAELPIIIVPPRRQ